MDKTNGWGVDSVFDTVGTEETIDLGIKVLAPKGVLVNLAVRKNKTDFSLDKINIEKSIRSSCNGLPEEFNLVLKLLAENKINVKSYITHKFPLEKVNEAFELLLDRTNSGALKIILKP